MVRVHKRRAVSLRYERLEGQLLGMKGGAVLMGLLWHPVSLERRVGGDGIMANREECQQGLWKDMLQRERLMVMEGLEWGRDRGSATLCVGCFSTLCCYFYIQSEKLWIMSLKVSLVFCFWVKVKQEHIKNSVKFYLEQKLNIRGRIFFWLLCIFLL